MKGARPVGMYMDEVPSPYYRTEAKALLTPWVVPGSLWLFGRAYHWSKGPGGRLSLLQGPGRGRVD